MKIFKKIQKHFSHVIIIFLVMWFYLDYKYTGRISDMCAMTFVLVVEIRYLGSKIMGEFD